MAILPAHPDLTVQVEVDDQPVPEYYDEDATQDSGSLTKYIEACSGSEFKISIAHDKPFPKKKDLGVCCYIDGFLVRQAVLRGTRHSAANPFFINGIHEKDGAIWRRRGFRFQDLGVGTQNRFLSSISKRDADSSYSNRIA
jgi:hypothetical protein